MSRRVDIKGNVTQGVAAGSIIGNVTVNAKDPDSVTDAKIKEWLFQNSVFHVVKHQRTHSAFSGKPENYLDKLESPRDCGRWLLEHALFTSWRDGLSTTGRLWCFGMPGLGKSTLASLVIDNLRSVSRKEAERNACLYVYFESERRGQCQYDSISDQIHVDLIKNLLAQLVTHTTPVSQTVKEHYEEFLNTDRSITLQSAVDLLKEESAAFGSVYIIVDALDRCPFGNGQDSDDNPRYAFLRRILDLSPKFKTLVVSTFQQDLTRVFGENQRVRICKEHIEADLRQFVGCRLRTAFQSEADEIADEAFRTTCSNAIIERSEGLYLRAKLLIKMLFSKKRTIEDLKIKLEDLPNVQDDIYRESVHDLIRHDNTERMLILNILQWLTFAMRPLTLEELSCAISVPDIGQEAHRETKLLTQDDIHRLCGEFVVCDGETVAIAHSTALDFLEKTYFAETDHTPESMIAEKCISYLTNPDLKTALSQQGSPTNLALRLWKFPLFNYAASHWHEHFLIANAEGANLESYVTEMMLDGDLVNSIANAMNSSKTETGVTGLHLAAILDLGDIVDRLVSRSGSKGESDQEGSKQHDVGLDKQTGLGETALHWSVRGSQRDDNPEMIEKLLRHGVDPNVKDILGKTALHHAIDLKRNNAALSFVASGTDKRVPHPLLIDTPDSQGHTPLMAAAKQGMADVVRALTRAGASLDITSQDECSALKLAAVNNHREVVEMLLRRNAKTELEGLSLMHWAASHGYENIVWHLSRQGADLNLATDEGSPLICAVRHGHRMLVWTLLHWGAKLDVSGPGDNTALHTALEKGDESTMWLLLERGANSNVQNAKGETPLHIAARKGRVSAAWLLLHKMSNPALRDKTGNMPIHITAAQDDASVLGALLQHAHEGKPATEALDDSSWLPIHIAAREGAVSSAHVLLNAGTDVNAATQDNSRHTPLHIAAEQGKDSARFIQFLMANCTAWLDINRPDAWGRTPLHAAVNSGDEAAVRALLAGGADPNVLNAKGLTPLHDAAVKGRTPVVKALLEYDADLEVLDEGEERYSAVEKAIMRWHGGEADGGSLLASLLHAGVDVNGRSQIDGWTPLHMAASLGSNETIELMYNIAVPRPDRTIKDADGKTAAELSKFYEHNIDWENWAP